MNAKELASSLELVRSNRAGASPVSDRLQSDPTLDLAHTRLDLERDVRCGHPEVVFGEGKRPADLVEIGRALVARHGKLLVTRAQPEGAAALLEALPEAIHHQRARCVTVGLPPEEGGRGKVVVASAGTCDGPVADEAAITARSLGAHVECLADVGVAGLHRLLAEVETLRSATTVVVVAGMEGALPSVVGGLVACPVIAVPTSVGYGTSYDGLAALLAMLNSCAPGVTVVNIDNGFGAGYAAAMIHRVSLATLGSEEPQAHE